ncbi:reverse transcriptase domain-containing protein [Tanacetum coccineum]
MTTPVEKRNHAKFCEFHVEVGHNTNEYIHLKKQIEEVLKAGKLSHLIKELKQNNGKEQPKAAKKEETSGKDKALAILMVQPWERVAMQRITKSFSPNPEIIFPPLGEDEGTKGPMIIKAEIGGHCIHRMPATTPLIGFSGEIIWPIEQIQLLVKIGDEKHSTSAWMNFMIVRSPSPYNRTIGRPGVRKLQAVLSIDHEMLKLPVEGGVITLKSSMMVPLECAMVSGPEGNPSATKQTVEERVKDAPLLDKDRNQAIQEEIGKLVKAGIMKEVHYHDWLSNLMMVKKHDDSWRMCVDFKGLNKACLKDGYPLPEIDWKVESLWGFPFKCFLDAYKGYHQSQMAKEDKEKTTFIKSQGIFYYTKMPFEKDFHWTEQKLKKHFQANESANKAELPLLVHCQWIGEGTHSLLAAVKEDVITDQPIQQVLSRPEVAGRLQKWSIELGEYAIHYRPRVSVKGQILADFIVERPEEDSLDTLIEAEEELPEPCILFMDGSSYTDGFGAGLILTNPKGMEFTYALRFRFDATNNEAEYEALISGLRIVEQMGVKNLQANVDSRLVANQVNGTYVSKEADMIQYLEKVRTRTGSFKAFSIRQVPKSGNKKANALNKIASTSFIHLSKQVLVKELKEKSISEVEILAVVEEEGDTWMTPIFKYLTEETLPVDVKKARAVRRKS